MRLSVTPFRFGFFVLTSVVAGFVIAGASLKNRLPYGLEARQHGEKLAAYIVREMGVCSKSAQNDTHSCYRTFSRLLMAGSQLSDVLTSLKETEHTPAVFAACHEVTHFLGRETYEKTRDMGMAFPSCSSVCHGGCYHGVVEAYLKGKADKANNEPALVSAISSVCSGEQFSTARLMGECLHGIGHAAMFITGSDLTKSLSLCDVLDSSSERETCYGGAFMENSTSSTTAPHPSRFRPTDDPNYPCSVLSNKYRNVCYQYQSSYFAELTKQNWPETITLCRKVPVEHQETCFRTIGTDQVGFTQDQLNMKAVCDLADDRILRAACIEGVVIGLGGRYVNDVARLKDFCGLLNGADRHGCALEAGRVLRTTLPDGSAIDVCRKLDDTDLVAFCREGFLNPASEGEKP